MFTLSRETSFVGLNYWLEEIKNVSIVKWLQCASQKWSGLVARERPLGVDLAIALWSEVGL